MMQQQDTAVSPGLFLWHAEGCICAEINTATLTSCVRYLDNLTAAQRR